MSSSTSTQDMVRPGECVDLFYYDGKTEEKQCFPTTVNTKYVQTFSNLTGGSSVFTIPPNMGIQDVVLQFAFDAAGGAGWTNANNAGLGLPAAWGYALIKQVSFRYGGSSQYFLTGDQILQNALRRQPSKTSADSIVQLGGNYTTASTSPSFSSISYANVVLTLPHSTPSGVGKAHPLPTDLLTQQCQITVELNPVNQIWSTNSVASTLPPTSLLSAQFVVQQVQLNNAGDALARRTDMSLNAYAYPAEFVQQKQVINLAAGTSAQSVVLTGFRSGEVRAIHCWLTRSGDTALNITPAGTDVVNPFTWYLPNSIIMSYAGDVYARYEAQSSVLFALINGNKPPAFQGTWLSAGSPPASGTPTSYYTTLSQWVELPFAQTHLDDDAHNMLVHGKPITNGIVNLDIVTPFSASDWQLNVSYIYNTTLLFSQGTVDYVF